MGIIAHSIINCHTNIYCFWPCRSHGHHSDLRLYTSFQYWLVHCLNMASPIVRILYEQSGAVLVGLSCVLLACCIVGRVYRRLCLKKNPGLPSVPILGSLPWLPRVVNHHTFTDWAKKYGNIYSIQLGSM